MKIHLEQLFFLPIIFIVPSAYGGLWDTALHGIKRFTDVRRVPRSVVRTELSEPSVSAKRQELSARRKLMSDNTESEENGAQNEGSNVPSRGCLKFSRTSQGNRTLRKQPSSQRRPSNYQKQVKFIRNNPGVPKRMPELVEEHGYPLETHKVETNDGYVLTLHRVRKKNFDSSSSLVALVWHGLMGSSADFFISGPEYALGFLLANNDFDVWLANERGNFYSKESTANNFWNYSIHEVGKYDVPACIDYVLKITEMPKIFAISHSTGAAAFLIALNERGIYQSKLHGLVAMAPCTTIQYSPSKLIQLLMRTYSLLKPEIMEKFIGKDELKISKELLESLTNSFCEGKEAKPFCDNILFMLTGYPKRSLSAPPEIINQNTPAGTSVKSLIHLAQMSVKGEFQAFDYGEEANLDIYGYSWPKNYIIDKLMTRVIFISSRDDEFVSDQDISALSKQISRLQTKLKVKVPNFGHSDFLFASDARENVYERLIMEALNLL